MKKEDIEFGDWERLFFGNAPTEFMVEVVLRTIFIYIILLVILRLLGKRMNAQASILELTVMVTLGAIIALPMQDPASGLLPGIIILFCVLAFQRTSHWLTYKNRRAEVLIEGHMAMLLKDGKLDVKQMRKAALSHEQLYSKLREEDIRHLGQVQRVYLEACGLFSIFRCPTPQPGLSIVPAKDEKFAKSIPKNEKYSACKNCGNVKEGKPQVMNTCDNCGENDWIAAIHGRKAADQLEHV